MSRSVDLVVIGGVLAGITAARDLKQRGFIEGAIASGSKAALGVAQSLNE